MDTYFFTGHVSDSLKNNINHLEAEVKRLKEQKQILFVALVDNIMKRKDMSVHEKAKATAEYAVMLG